MPRSAQSNPPYALMFSPVDLDRRFPIQTSGIQTKRPAPLQQLHRHNCWEIGFCHDGRGVYAVNGRLHPFAPATVTLFPAGLPHFSTNAPGTESRWTWVMFDPALLLAGFAPDAAPYLQPEPFAAGGFDNVFPANEFPELPPMVEQLIRELRKRAEGHRCAVRCLVLGLLVCFRRLAPPVTPGAGRPSADNRVLPALEYISRHYAESLTVPALAARCHVCPVHFRRLFRAATGMLPYEYLNRYRIRLAECLLAGSEETILDISARVGFRSLSSFNRQFRKFNGTSPHTWRRNH